MKREYTFQVNGFPTTAVYDDRTVEMLFVPLIRRWTKMRREKGRRILVFLSAPPGVGKTTVAQFLEQLSKQREDMEPLQAVGLDGFHYHAQEIALRTVWVDGREVPMKQIKGAPETYDIEKLTRTLELLAKQDVTWPIYDRNRHDVVENAVEVTAGIVLVEGNWLLSTEGAWAPLIRLCDDSVFIEADGALLRERLIARKMRGGLSYEEAEQFYARSDRKNILRLLAQHHQANVCWRMETDGSYLRRDEKTEERMR